MPLVTVRSGDTLSGILKSQGVANWASPVAWARVPTRSNDPNLIYPGEVLNIPERAQPQQQTNPVSAYFQPNTLGGFPTQPNQTQSNQNTPNPISPYFQPNTVGGFQTPTTPQPQQFNPLAGMNPFNPPSVQAAETNYTLGSAVSSPNFVQGTPDWVKDKISKASKKWNIPTMLLSALIKQESGFNPNAVSPVGARGIAQFMPATARSFGIDPNNVDQAIDAAAKYLKTEWDYFGKPELALAAYNAGRGAVRRFGGIPPYKETQNYVKGIMAQAGEPHQSFYGPTLDIVNQAKKQTKR